MKRILLACHILLLALTVDAAPGAPSSEESAILQLTREFDRAIEQKDEARVARFLHDGYIYTGPELPKHIAELQTVVQKRLSLGGGESADVVARVVGPTAVVTGSYTVKEKFPSPRFLTRGRFSSTWIKTPDGWRLLAEHRSLNDELEWAPSETARQRAAAKATPLKPDATAIVTSGLPPDSPPPAPPPASAFASTDNVKKTAREETRTRHGHLPKSIAQLFRSYEPSQVGYTKDQGDQPFMDFTFSAMFPLPLIPGDYPDAIRRRTDEPFFRHTDYSGPNFYFAATIRAGQYIGTRPSSPVVSKRFNPLFAVRFWGKDIEGMRDSVDNFVEVSYGHESNGQFIANQARFDEQRRVYLNQFDAPLLPARNTAYLSARDNISRGWDYVGVQFARDFDTNAFDAWAPDATIGFRAKFNYYLKKGFLQGDAEEYNPAWEASPSGVLPDPEGRARKYVDGLSFRYTLTVAPPREQKALTGWSKLLRFERRYALTWTTGYAQPFRYNTVKAEAGLNIYGLPVLLWYRYGYNSDLIDYYRQDHSYGLSLSFWNF